MRKYFEPEFKKKIVRLHLEDGRTIRSLAAEYSISKASISNWVSRFRKECRNNEEVKVDYDYMKEDLNLKKQLAELQKENDFLKKRWHSPSGNRLAAYQFIKEQHEEFGLRGLLRKLSICPNAYYNY